MTDILLKYILWHQFLNDLDTQSHFDKKIVTKKLVKYNHSYLKYALGYQLIQVTWGVTLKRPAFSFSYQNFPEKLVKISNVNPTQFFGFFFKIQNS